RQTQTERCRYRRGDDQYLPLRHLSAHPRRGAHGRRPGDPRRRHNHQQRLREIAMTKINHSQSTKYDLSRRPLVVRPPAVAGGSRGIRTSQDYVRRGGATARMMLMQAAADQWKVPVSELTVSNGMIRHAASKRVTSYGKVAAAAAKLTPPDPKSIVLKDPK